MKKVLFALNNMNVGGTEKAFLNLLDTLSPDDYEVTLLLLEAKGGFLPFVPNWVRVEALEGYTEGMKAEIMNPPLRVIRDKVIKRDFLRAFSLLTSYLWYKLTKDRTFYYKVVLRDVVIPQQYDVAIAFAGPFDFITMLVTTKVVSKEKIQWIHFDTGKIFFDRKTSQNLYKKIDKIYCVSDSAKESLLRQIPSLREKTTTRYNYVSGDLCRKMAEEQSQPLREGDERIIVTLGRLSPEKGQDIIPDIAKELIKDGISFRWFLIGDGSLREIIEEKIKEEGLQERVILLGTVINPYPYLKQADCYVQTSIHEGFCITLAEAKVFDLPIISTDCAGAHEQLDNVPQCHVVPREIMPMLNAILKEIKYAKGIHNCSGLQS